MLLLQFIKKLYDWQNMWYCFFFFFFFLRILSGYLVDLFNHMILVFKQYYTHFHTLFHPHLFHTYSHIFKQENICFQTHVSNTL